MQLQMKVKLVLLLVIANQRCIYLSENVVEMYAFWKAQLEQRKYLDIFGLEPPYNKTLLQNNLFYQLCYFSNHFKSMGCPVPQILTVSEDRRTYLQEDFGETSLLNCLENDGYTSQVYELFQLSLKNLAEPWLLEVHNKPGIW